MVPPGRTTPRGRVGGRGQHILWDVVTPSSDSPVWSVVWYGDREFAGGYFLSFSLYGSGCLDRGVVPPGRTTPRGRVGGRGQHILWDVVTPSSDSPVWSVVWYGDREFAGGYFLSFLLYGSGCLDRGVVPPGRTTPRGRVGGRGQHILWDVVTPSSDSPAGWSVVWYGDREFAGGYFLSFSLYGSGCLDRGVVPPGRTTPRGRVGGRGQHILWDVVTPSSDSPVWRQWSGMEIENSQGGIFFLLSLYGSGCLDRGVVPPGPTTPRGRVGGRGQHILWDVVTPSSDSPVWSGQWSGMEIQIENSQAMVPTPPGRKFEED